MYKKSVQEVGRSILEMLGVLAIVGILSVVGVVGWQYGMDKYAANDVLNEANIRGFDVLANYKDRKLPDLTMLPGYQKKTTTGRPIFVIPNPSDFNWAEYPEKCESADYCQAFDVEVRGITERQCEIIMNSNWRLPDSIFVTQTPQNTTMTTPLAITASADRIAKRTTAKLNTNLCHFSDVDIDLTLRFRFVSTYTDFSNTKDDGGWDETTPTPDDGETGGGESVEEEPEDTPCPTGQERNDKGDCVCKPNHYGESCIECLSPRKWDDIYGCICAGVKSVWDSGEQTCVCPANHYGANCVRCMEPREWVNNDCICNGPKRVWNNETQLCECPKNYYTEDCSVYCAGEYASWNGTACVCSFRNSEWSPTERACVCKDDYYGTNCDYCAGEHTKWDDGNNRCICTLQNSTWNKDKNVCECLNNYYGTNCDYCAGTHASWNSSTNKCECSLTHSHWTGSACVCDTDYYGPSCVYCAGANSKWDSTNNKCTCTLANSTWNTTQNKCICNTNYYGPSCTYCAGNYTKWDSTNNKCTCTQTSREWNASKKACVCKTGYWGDNCTYCAGDYTKWDTTTNSCTCTLANSSWDATNKKCVCINGTTWSESEKSCVTPGSTEDTCYAPRLWINGICTCPTTTPYYKSSTNECLKCYQVNESKPYWNGSICTICPSDKPYWDTTKKECVACATFNVDTPVWDSTNKKCISCYASNNAKPYWNGTKCIACYEKSTSTPVWSTAKNQCVSCVTLDSTKPAWSTTNKKCDTCYAVNNAKPHWNGSACEACPTATPYWDGTQCVACATFNVDTPVWDSTNKKCTSCYASNNAKPYWNGTKCIACYEKSTSTPVWSTSKNQCVACETLDKTKPFWDTTKKECVAICPTDKPTYNSNKVCVTCSSLNSAKPYWNGSKCVACLDNTHCKDNYYCNTSSTYACEELNCDKMGFETRAFYCSYVDFGSWSGYTPWMKIDKGYNTGEGDWTEVSGCRNSILVVPKDFQGELTLSNCRVGTITIDGVEYKLNGTTYTLNLKKGIHSITFRTKRNKGAESCRIKFHLTPGWDICMHYIENCPEGYYCEPDKLNPISCPSGYYCPVESYLGPTSCDDDTYTNEVSKTECERCSNRFWRSSNNYCYRCDHTSTIETTKDACEHCANRYWVDGKCYPCPSGMTRDTNTGICKCNTNYIYDRDSKTCVACSTTDHFASTELSTEKSCPAKRFYADNADSYVCTDATNHPVTTQANCLFCGSKNVRYWRSNDGDCFSCNFVEDGYTSNTTDTECHTCSNRYWRSDNYCYHCSHSSTREKILQTECERCPTRHWVGTIAATATTPTLGNCYLCPTGMTRDTNTGICKCNTNYIYDRDSKTCVSCTETTSGVLSTEKATEASCPQTRYYANDAKAYSCSVTTQNPETTKNNCLFCGTNVRFWKSKNNYCYHCLDTDEVADTTKAECEICTNRYWVDGKCYPCPSGMTRDTNTGICKCNTNYIYDRDLKTCVACSTTGHFASTELSTEKSCPAKRFYADNADSYVCTDVTNHPVTTQANCLFCGSKNVRYWRSNDSECFSCNFVEDGYTSNTTDTECHTCSNRYWRSDNYCYHCSHSSTREKILQTECERCPTRHWVGTIAATATTPTLGNCYLCPTGMTRDTNTGICKCNTNYIYDRDSKTCVACSTTDHFASTELSTEKSCPAKRFYADNADSYVCTDATNHPETTQANCLFCGSKNVRYWRSNDGDCFSCNFVGDGYTSDTTQAECHTCANRYWKSNNNCFYCEHTDYRESVEQEECNRCTNRFWKSNKICFHCSRSDATSDITQSECNRCTHRFWKSNGYCYNCDRTDSASDITQAECNRCTNRFWKSNGNCYNCSASSVKEVTKAECIRCSNRYWTVTDTTNGLGTCTKCASGKTPNADKTACE